MRLRALAKKKTRSRSRIGLRVYIYAFWFLLITAGILYRLFDLTVIRHVDFARSAKNQQYQPSAQLAGRGTISAFDFSTDKRKLIVANDKTYFIFVNPKTIANPEQDAHQLATLLKRNEEDLIALITARDKNYVIVADELTKAQADGVSALKNSNFHLATSVERKYLKGPLAAQVLGYVGYDGYERVGQYGVESYYDDILNGQNRTQLLAGNQTYASLAKTISSKLSSNNDQTIRQADNQEGEDITLSIDPNIQFFIESKLGEIIRRWSASGGNIIVQDPKTGAILAMASSPSFDPNNYGAYNVERFLNPATQKIFEPGSSFKAVTMAAGIDTGAIRPTSTYVDSGPIKVGDYTIKNATDKIFGTVTMTQVLENSLNTGSMFVVEKTGNDNFLKYVTSFGFGQKTGIDSAGEVSGNIGVLYSGRKINFDTASFGQGVAVTPIQLINAYSAIANNGRLMRPMLVADIQHHDGTFTKRQPEIIDVPITESTARDVITMLTAVVDHHLTSAQIRGYDIAAKTGTAQIPDAKGGYESPDQVIHNIVGFAPARQARFTLLIKVDRPKGVKFSAESLSPSFAEISRFLLRYLNVPPTRQ